MSVSLPETQRPQPGSEVPGGVRYPTQASPRTPPPWLRELLGLVLFLAGLSALAVAAWFVDWRAGLAATGAVFAVCGLLVGLQP